MQSSTVNLRALISGKVWLMLLTWVILGALGCQQSQDVDEEIVDFPAAPFKTKNVIVVVIDGPRFSETWGDPTKSLIPNLAYKLGPVGVHYNWFYNNGPTYTSAGHAAITTGHYQIMANDGSEFPEFPSFLQLYLNHTRLDPRKAQIVTSKAKLAVLGDCSTRQWRGRFNPIVDAQDRVDSLTFKRVLQVLREDNPHLMLIQFRGPDAFGHANNWQGYLSSIQETDAYLWDLWQFLQAHPSYANQTTLFVTNDHGRHLDHIKDGFVSHGDQCEGCLHINLFATGPDFKTGITINKPREQVDIAPTIAHLLGFKSNQGAGGVLHELFNHN